MTTETFDTLNRLLAAYDLIDATETSSLEVNHDLYARLLAR